MEGDTELDEPIRWFKKSEVDIMHTRGGIVESGEWAQTMCVHTCPSMRVAWVSAEERALQPRE